MPPLSTFDIKNRNGLTADVSSSHSTISAVPGSKGPISPPPSRPTTRRVSFGEVSCVDVICLDAYSPEESKNSWYTSEEYALMREARKRTVKIMEKENSKIDDGNVHCFRGLETKTRDGSRRKQFNVVDAVMAVLDEQGMQDEHGVSDPERISDVYVSCNSHCLEAAMQRGLSDEKAAIAAWSASVA